MQAFGVELAKKLDDVAVLELIGDVGAGKTTLTRALARGLGIMEPIQSPTFTISNRYTIPDGGTFVHYDFYRLHDAGIMKDELEEVMAAQDTITVIEWGDIIADVLPPSRLTIEIQPRDEHVRELTITSHDEASGRLEKELAS